MIIKSLFAHDLADDIKTTKAISKSQGDRLFQYFLHSPLFSWDEASNDCEDRANAICLLLKEWGIDHAKAWVFSGYVFNKIGYLKNLWKYHVAAAVPVLEGSSIIHYVIDPATCDHLVTVEDWAVSNTDNPHSFHFLKTGDTYIFHRRRIRKDNWHKIDKRNYNWTMQGLSGINGMSAKGRAQLAFMKSKVVKTRKLFTDLKNSASPID